MREYTTEQNIWMLAVEDNWKSFIDYSWNITIYCAIDSISWGSIVTNTLHHAVQEDEKQNLAAAYGLHFC